MKLEKMLLRFDNSLKWVIHGEGRFYDSNRPKIVIGGYPSDNLFSILDKHLPMIAQDIFLRRVQLTGKCVHEG